jgi:hypothetical protein
MQKPAHGNLDVQLLGSLPKHKREEHKVIVVHPDVIAVSQMGHNRICESLVRFAIRRHGVQVELDFVELVVEQWPDRGICHRSINISMSDMSKSMRTREAIIVELGCTLVKQYRNSFVIFRKCALQSRYILLGYLEPRPAEPEKVDTTVCKPSESRRMVSSHIGRDLCL